MPHISRTRLRQQAYLLAKDVTGAAELSVREQAAAEAAKALDAAVKREARVSEPRCGEAEYRDLPGIMVGLGRSA